VRYFLIGAYLVVAWFAASQQPSRWRTPAWTVTDRIVWHLKEKLSCLGPGPFSLGIDLPNLSLGAFPSRQLYSVWPPRLE
jgi:hypothetical protein